MGPLAGTRVLELPNIGPIQFAGMVLSDLGAEVLRVDRVADVTGDAFVSPFSVLDRGRRSVAVDLKHERGAETVLGLVNHADVLIEGMRPGVAERLGVGPDACRARNPRLVYGRMTGWGQAGPLAADPGHDINYIALAGVLHHIGPAGGPPVPPINLLGDFGGGGLLLALGVVSALLERERSGEGQVVDTAMVDGAAQLMSIFFGLDAMGFWSEERGTNLLDGGAHFYGAYETSDGKWVSIASYEPKFYAELVRVLDLDLPLDEQMDKEQWPALKERMAGIFRTRTRDEWVEFFDGHEVCFAPVLTMKEAQAHPHNVARRTFVEVDGAPHPAPAPRFDRTPTKITRPPVAPGADTDAALTDWGFAAGEVADLRAAGAIA